jgi:hypothetical protein
MTANTVHLQLVPLPIAGIPQPLRVHLDFDTEVVDEICSASPRSG